MLCQQIFWPNQILTKKGWQKIEFLILKIYFSSFFEYQTGPSIFYHLIYDLMFIPREILDDLNITQGMQAMSQYHTQQGGIFFKSIFLNYIISLQVRAM